VVTHHEVVQVVGHQLGVLLLTVRSTHQPSNLLESLRLQADLYCVHPLELTLEWETRRKSIRRTFVGDCAQELHGVVGRNAVAESDCVAGGDGFGEEERDVIDRPRVW
jgi:hypothetical protein